MNGISFDLLVADIQKSKAARSIQVGTQRWCQLGSEKFDGVRDHESP
jgi:hypothetical protein